MKTNGLEIWLEKGDNRIEDVKGMIEKRLANKIVSKLIDKAIVMLISLISR